jgi:hypothetical protein
MAHSAQPVGWLAMSAPDSEIVAALISGLSERDVCLQLGCTMGRVRAALDESRWQ